jgi:hypothetical protein
LLLLLLKERKMKHVLIQMGIALALISCKAAEYEVLRPSKNNEQTITGGPSIPPTARLEAIDRGVSVTWVYVGTAVEFRPTVDTVDPDYLNNSACTNPGIVQASYNLGDGTTPIINRPGCESLSVQSHVFQQPGVYNVTMEVLSQDNERAYGSMVFKVIPQGTPKEQIEGGFTIHGVPLLAGIGQNVTFTGICELQGQRTINWDFGDSQVATGDTSTHAYTAPGQYIVKATCQSSNGTQANASLTVVVMTGTPPVLTASELPDPNRNPGLPNPTPPISGCNQQQQQTGTCPKPKKPCGCRLLGQ